MFVCSPASFNKKYLTFRKLAPRRHGVTISSAITLWLFEPNETEKFLNCGVR